MQDQRDLIWLVALENIVSFATLCMYFPVQPSTETSLFLHALFCFANALSFCYRMKNHCNVWMSK